MQLQVGPVEDYARKLQQLPELSRQAAASTLLLAHDDLLRVSLGLLDLGNQAKMPSGWLCVCIHDRQVDEWIQADNASMAGTSNAAAKACGWARAWSTLLGFLQPADYDFRKLCLMDSPGPPALGFGQSGFDAGWRLGWMSKLDRQNYSLPPVLIVPSDPSFQPSSPLAWMRSGCLCPSFLQLS